MSARVTEELKPMDDARQFLEHAFRNIDLPPLSRDDMRDIADGLERFALSRTTPTPASMVTEESDLIAQLRGRAAFLRDRGEIKTPELLEDAATTLTTLSDKNAKLVEAAQVVLDGLNARIDAAPMDAVPVFAGIADLHDAINAFKKEQSNG